MTLHGAALAALLAALGMMIVLPIVLLIEDRRYIGIEKEIESDVLLRENVNFQTNAGVRNGYVLMTQNHVYLFSRSRKPYFEARFPREKINSVQVMNDIYLKIFLSETDFINLSSSAAKHIVNKMVELKWIDEKNAIK